MKIEVTPEIEKAVISLAAKIRGSRGGRTMTPKKLKVLRRTAKAARAARLQSAAA